MKAERANLRPDPGSIRVLIVEQNPTHRQALQVLLDSHDFVTVAADQPGSAVRELAASRYDLVVCSVAHLSLIAELAVSGSSITVVATVLCSEGKALEHASATAALAAGAYDVVPIPPRWDRLGPVLGRAAERGRLVRENRRLAARQRPSTVQPVADGQLGGMVGESAAMCRVFKQVRQVAPYTTNVLITGESGTGKELVARAIHDLSPRAEGPFVAVNCGAIPAPLLESELFGHRKGSFTDAVRDKLGLFEEASGGTLFLDEIGELPLDLQVKLLRALQEGEVRRIGDNRPTIVDSRIVAATVRDLESDAKQGRFREDLFYRLNVLPLQLPPLRDRPEDIRMLALHFMRVYADKHTASNLSGVVVADAAMELLTQYSWPGNIRELENTIERAMVLCENGVIGPDLLEGKLSDPSRRALPSLDEGELSIKKSSRVLERELISRALERTGGNRTNASKLLEISHRALLYKIKEYGL